MDMDLTFVKSSYSGNRQDCVEVAKHPAVGAAVRDTKNRERGHLPFAASEWSAFVKAVKTEAL